MAALKNNKKCIVCGKIYTYCPTCSEYRTTPRWKGIFHEENCKNLYDIVCDFDAGMIKKDDALSKLMECDLVNMEKFHPAIAETLHKILAD